MFSTRVPFFVGVKTQLWNYVKKTNEILLRRPLFRRTKIFSLINNQSYYFSSSSKPQPFLEPEAPVEHATTTNLKITFEKGLLIKEVCRNDDTKMLHVQWSNGTKGRFLYAWLRDNCPEKHTYNLSSICKARIMIMNDLDVDVQPTEVENFQDEIYIMWPGGHKSYYTTDWLQERNLDNQNVRTRRKQVNLDDKELWSSEELKKKMKWIKFDEILYDDLTLHDALTNLCKLGVVFIDSVPPELGQLKKLATRIGFEYLTHYGHFFTVKSHANPTNVAYRNGALGFHSDLPYLQYAPQVQALHCIEQVKNSGGENQIVDGFRVASIMAEKYPELYKILCTVPLEYIDDGQDFVRFDLTYNRPVFNFDRQGRLAEIHFSNQQRSWFYDVPPENLHDVYRAMKMFNSVMYSPENCFEFKMLPGQMIIFHNLRVLHARSYFELNPDSGGRLMEGCYFNLDIIKSKIRVLRDQLDLKPNQISI